MEIKYQTNTAINADEFIDLLERSGLAERRPVDDRACIEGMLEHANLSVTAWHDQQLIGIARSMTDFHYACYLSDLAVDKSWQGKGVGKKLQDLTQQALGPKCKLILLAAPSADTYYEHVGYTRHPRCWLLEAQDKIKS